MLVPYPMLLPQPLGSAADRNELKMNVSPLESERCSVTIASDGMIAFGFSATIAGSFHCVILPW